ncbi:unnamed protein product [Bursaphelenchus xylophilus]|uniref:(pine wood nematode) hypothetical protein n=1 Tax=Bursaphelenchus xylophilus TaxID=6326 RepID=A0A1I7SU73_BURXY|nr:unnamed protein product [Bursaphelenchus xylophilus]CAG9107484.1 unnamed protein product [Bursaphelenchus xylophilus]
MPCKGEELCDEVTTEQGHHEEVSVASRPEHPSSPIALKPTQPITIPGSELSPSLDDTLNSFVDMSLRNMNPSENGGSVRSNDLEKRPKENGSSISDMNRTTLTWESVNSLPGEELRPEHVWDMAHVRVFMSNYRLVIITYNKQGVTSIPNNCIDLIEISNDDVLKLLTRDGRIFTFKAAASDVALHFYKTILPLTCGGQRIEDSFAYRFAVACQSKKPTFLRRTLCNHEMSYTNVLKEYNNCGFKPDDWRVTRINEDFSVCASYPQFLIVPSETSDQEFRDFKRGRFFDRFPTAVWRSKKTGAVLMRSAQPETSFFGSQPEGDARLFDAIRKSCIRDRPEKQRKVLIVDARSYTAAWANRAKGGGFESGDAYAMTEVLFMGLPNIHALRYSFHQLRQLLHGPENLNFFQNLQQTNWFQYLYSLILSAQRCVDALCIEGISALVHCSDGWDRTSQIVSLTKLIADPFYRTFEGFEYLINREWVEFGHKFHDRNGLCPDTNEKAPVFLQFLDAVHQLWLKNPDRFEFNQRYLMKIAQHHHSALFGTFIFNNFQESVNGYICNANNSFMTPFQVGSPDDESIVNLGRVSMLSVFDYVGKHNPCFINPVYVSGKRGRLMCPKGMWELNVWREVYCCTDVESVINCPERATETPNQEEIKVNGMSRSQSAASLNSLEQANGHHVSHGSAHNTSTGSQPVPLSSTPVSNTFLPTLPSSTFYMRKDHMSWKHYLDHDGLSRVPIDYEDRFIELHRHYQNTDAVRVSESSSSGRENYRSESSALRCRVESSDSTISYDMCEDDVLARKKRDSVSSNLLFPVEMNSGSSHFGSLDEEITRKCRICNTSVTFEGSNSPMTTSNTTLVNGSSTASSPSKMKNGTCARCAANQVPIHTPTGSNRLIMS